MWHFQLTHGSSIGGIDGNLASWSVKEPDGGS